MAVRRVCVPVANFTSEPVPEIVPVKALVSKAKSDPMVSAFAPRATVPLPKSKPTFSLPPSSTVAPADTERE